MSNKLAVNINSDTAKVLRWAELEKNRTPEEVIAIGAKVLQMIENSESVRLVESDGTVTEVYSINPDSVSDIYDF